MLIGPYPNHPLDVDADADADADTGADRGPYLCGSMPTQIYGMPPLLSSVGLEIGTTPNPAQGIYLAPQKQIHEGWSPAPRRAFRSWSFNIHAVGHAGQGSMLFYAVGTYGSSFPTQS